MRRFLGFLLALGMWTAAAATALPPPLDAPAPEAPSGIADVAGDPGTALAWGQALSATVATAGPTEVLRTLLHAAQGGNAPAAVAHADASLAAGVPTALAPSLARLVGAVAAAEALRADALAALTPDEVAAVLAGGLLAREALPAPEAVPLPGGEAWVGHASAGPAEPTALARTLAVKVDLAALETAGLTLLAAAEAALPALQAMQGAATDQPRAPATCPGVTGNMLYESPTCLVLVGDAGVNSYAPPAAPLVIVDVGGNDAYHGSAAAAATLGVRLLVDVAGDDLYLAAHAASGAGVPATVLAQAAGNLGVALLLDADGSDGYIASATAAAPQPGAVAGAATVIAQGAGNLGAGVLVDLGAGVDRYTATARSSGGDTQTTAQGAGNLGAGALLDLSPGQSDTYLATATSTLHQTVQTPTQTVYAIGGSLTTAQGGGGVAGVGVFAEADGDDGYTAHAVGGTAQADVQGGANVGAALLVDALGSDTMDAAALGTITLALIATDTSFCWRVSTTVTTGPIYANAQGGTGPGPLLGVGLAAAALVDASGDDRRTLRALSEAVAIAEARSAFDCPSFGLSNEAHATATSGPGVATGQGSAEVGAAVLVDGTGADAGTLDGRSRARARAVAISPGADIENPSAAAGHGTTHGQGYAGLGVGVAVDGVGDDTWRSFTDSRAIRETSAGTTVSLGPTIQQVHGFDAGAGLGQLLDLDGTDAYPTSPGGASAAADKSCWSNGASNGRGRDWSVLSDLPPFVCN